MPAFGNVFTPLAESAVPTECYSYRMPSPPLISAFIPPPMRVNDQDDDRLDDVSEEDRRVRVPRGRSRRDRVRRELARRDRLRRSGVRPEEQDEDDCGDHVDLVPAFERVDSTMLSRSEYQIIMRGQPHHAEDSRPLWLFEHRYQAQSILDFVYVGPTSIVRDTDFLVRDAITMLIVIREARPQPVTYLSVEKANTELGIDRHYIDVGTESLTHIYPDVVRLINQHMVTVHRALDPQSAEAGRHGKVLIVCDSGTQRSATLAAAYIMAMYGAKAAPAIQFLNLKRCCCNLDVGVVHSLQVWDNILLARHIVAWKSVNINDKAERDQHQGTAMDWEATKPADDPKDGTGPKRAADKMAVDEYDSVDEEGNAVNDLDRFRGRHGVAPFRDESSVCDDSSMCDDD